MRTGNELVNWFNFTIVYLIGVFVICFNQPKRKYFVFRVIISLVVLAGFITGLYFVNKIPDLPINFINYIKYYGHCILLLLIVLFCYDCDFFVSLFCITTGYCYQHISQKIYVKILYLFAENHIQLSEFANIFIFVLISTLCYAISYFTTYFENGHFSRKKLAIASPIQLTATALSLFVVIFVDFNTFGGRYYIYASIICAMLTILVENLSLERETLKEQNAILNALLSMDKEQFELEKANEEKMNILIHDMRHQLRNVDNQNNFKNNIEKIIEKYDSVFDTGNFALNLVLNKFYSLCKNKKIIFKAILDGNNYDFIDSADIFSLFGNAIENAVNAVTDLDESNRIISISEKKYGNFLNICFENYYDGKEIIFENRLPTSIQENHGYGMKSINLVAKKYNGRINISTNGNIFVLNIFFNMS